MTDAALEAGARAWFDRVQSQRMDPGGKRPDGQRWQWEDITESDRVAYRALARPIVEAALKESREDGRRLVRLLQRVSSTDHHRDLLAFGAFDWEGCDASR